MMEIVSDTDYDSDNNYVELRNQATCMKVQVIILLMLSNY